MAVEEVLDRKVRFWADTTGELELIAKTFIKTEMQALRGIRFQYAWRSPARKKHGKPVYGECRKCSTRERDLFSRDVLIVIAQPTWLQFNKKQKQKLIWHELYHVDVPLQDTLEPEVDDRGRIKFYIRKHDCNLERFYDELTRFGPDAEERTAIRRLSKIYREWKTENGAKA